MRVSLIVGTFLLFSSLSLWAQDTTKVLFIGNSFTNANNLPELFRQLSVGAGEPVVIASHMPGGISVGDISQGTSAHMNNPVVYDLIRSNDWDYLVLQDNQGRFCLGYGQFPPSSLVVEGHLKIRDSLLYHHPCAHMILFAGFGPKDGYPPYGDTGPALNDTIYRNYQFMNQTTRQILAAIGPAFNRIIPNYPSIDLWSSDEVHPSLNGSFLTANVIFSTIYKKSPIESTYNAGLSDFNDSLFKTTAFITTLDSINTTGLQGITPEIDVADNQLSVTGFQACEWFRNGLPYQSTDCSISANESGEYFALVTDADNCTYRTLNQTVISTKIDFESELESNWMVYPNPCSNSFELALPSHIELGFKLEIYSVDGRLMKQIAINQSSQKVDVSTLAKGMYHLVYASSEFSIRQKLLIE